VVRVAVAAVGVVTEEDVRLFLVEDRGEALGRLVGVGPDEAGATRRVRKQLRAEPAVGIAEVFHPRDTQGPCARLELVTSPRGETARRVGLRCQPQFAVGRDDEHHAMPVGRGARQRARREEGLVVRVGMEGEQRVGHEWSHLYA